MAEEKQPVEQPGHREEVPNINTKLTPEKIKAMKKAGIPKPIYVSWGDWVGPKKINARHEIVIYLAAVGRKGGEIAQAVRMTESQISILLSNTEIQRRIGETQEKVFGEDHKKRFTRILPGAISTAENIMLDTTTKPAVRLKAAQDLINRAIGKPKEKIEIEGVLEIRKVFERLDQLERGEEAPVDAEFQVVETGPAEPEKTLDEVDKFLAEVPKL